MSKVWAPDRKWTEDQWKKFLEQLITQNLFSWKEVTETVLGALNPPQVGTSIATNKNFQAHYPARKTWKAVREWFYSQKGFCVSCGTRLNLQAEHIISREEIGKKADKLSNLQLMCRRCNVIKRPSHKKGGLTFLTTQAALMWLLFVYNPKKYSEYEKLCRKYGLTMANIRFQEAWAIAKWLKNQ